MDARLESIASLVDGIGALTEAVGSESDRNRQGKQLHLNLIPPSRNNRRIAVKNPATRVMFRCSNGCKKAAWSTTCEGATYE
jgi:hypothetical protein